MPRISGAVKKDDHGTLRIPLNDVLEGHPGLDLHERGCEPALRGRGAREPRERGERKKAQEEL